MKACEISSFKSAPQIVNYPDPTVSKDSVIIDTNYVSLNHRENLIISGKYKTSIKLPHILGSDLSGRITQVGDDVEGFSIGDRVVRYPLINCGRCLNCNSNKDICDSYRIIGNALCQRLEANPARLIKIPDNVSDETASCLPVAYLTAWRMLNFRGDFSHNESLLVHGASGGVGIASIQLATETSSNVIAVTSENFVEKIDKLKIWHVINRESEDIKDTVNDITDGAGVDMVIDPVGEATMPTSVDVVRHGGRILCCGRKTGRYPNLDLLSVFSKQIDIRGSSMGTIEEFRDLIEFISEHHIEIPYFKTFSFEHVQEAFGLMNRGEFIGKILVRF